MKQQLLQPIEYYVRGLFRNVAETANIAEQREELKTHIIDRIQDGISKGLSEQEAFSDALESLGNLDELVETIIGTKRTVYLKKMNWYLMAAALVWGTIYMASVGYWFATAAFGTKALAIAIPGWLAISVSCWIVNMYFLGGEHFLNTVWAWMPTAGVLTWPLMNMFGSWMVNHLDSIRSDPQFTTD
ncbi:MAG: hypothetical protein EWM51_02260 [Treponema sp.]|nr:MAG: hypothetical protein EWM51_02260 [Treponema sp.]